MDGADLSFDEHGAVRHDRAAFPVLDALEAVLASVPRDRVGVRLHGVAGLMPLLGPECSMGRVVAERLGSDAKPVRAILFNKTAAANWSLGWHQDRTVSVRQRHDVPGYGPWSTKAGLQHVEPPFAIIEAMVTLRVHLDDVPADNAPLLVAPGSHRYGRIAEADIAETVARCGTATCLARRGDLWAYATPILHASAVSQAYAHRRVLQLDYAAAALAPPLEWLGI